jgi:superfamily II DNA or RNA helicase
MSVKIVVGNVHSKIVGYLPEEVHEELRGVLSYWVKGAEHSKKFQHGKWDGYIRLYNKAMGQSFYSGLASIVSNILLKYEIPHNKVNGRERPNANLSGLVFTPDSSYQERDYQTATIEMAYQKTRGVLKMATGAGKTTVVTKLISKIKTGPFMFYVLNTDLLDQAHDTLSRYLNEPIGKIGGGECDIKNINVCTIQTAIRAINLDNPSFDINEYKYDDDDQMYWKAEDITDVNRLNNIRKLIYASRGLYFDEMHHASASTAKSVLSASTNAYWRYGGSATPYREDGAEILLQALFGKKIVDINASYLIQRGWLLTPHIFFVPVEHDVAYHSYPKLYKTCISQNDILNCHIANLSTSLMNKGLSTLVLVQTYAQGDAIKAFLKDSFPNIQFITGKMSRANRQSAIDAVRSKQSMGMIATSLADEGLDVPTLDAAILGGGGASATRTNQRVGRTIRPDYSMDNFRKDSVVVYYDHKVKHLHDHAVKAKKILKEEPLFDIRKSKGMNFIEKEIFDIMKIDDQGSLFDL